MLDYHLGNKAFRVPKKQSWKAYQFSPQRATAMNTDWLEIVVAQIYWGQENEREGRQEGK